MQKYIKYVVLAVFVAIAGAYFMNPNIVHYFDIQNCKNLVSAKMKDPESTKFMDYTFEKDDKGTITITGKYRATNSYGAYMQGAFSCVEGGGIPMQPFIN